MIFLGPLFLKIDNFFGGWLCSLNHYIFLFIDYKIPSYFFHSIKMHYCFFIYDSRYSWFSCPSSVFFFEVVLNVLWEFEIYLYLFAEKVWLFLRKKASHVLNYFPWQNYYSIVIGHSRIKKRKPSHFMTFCSIMLYRNGFKT